MSWNNRRNNSNGNILRNLIDKHPINVLFPASPTFLRGKNTSTIDIFLANITVSTKCCIENDLSSSHFPVIIDIDSSNPISILKKYPTTDWTAYTQLASNYIINNNITSSAEVDFEINRFNSQINMSFRKATSFSLHHNRSFPYLPEIHALIKERNMARRNFQRTNNPYFRLLRNMLSQQIHIFLDRVKISEWNKRLSKLKVQDHSLWNHYKIFTRKKLPIPLLEDPNNNSLHDDASKANSLADTFQQIHSDSLHAVSFHEGAANQIINKILNSVPKFAYSSFSTQSLRNIIKSRPNNKSPGVDKILHLKNLHKEFLVQLYYILQATLRVNYFPKSWKLAVVIPILKSGKNKIHPSSNRPVNLLSICGKIPEQIISIEFKKHMYSNNILADQQFGF